MRAWLAPLALPVLLLAAACNDPAPVSPDPQRIAPRAEVLATTERPPTSPVTRTSTPKGPRGTVVLVVLGRPFPADLLDEIEQTLRDELHVEVTRHERIPLPKKAYYPKRKRYRAETLLDHLLTLIPDEPATTRVLGLTTVDISTTKGKYPDWGIFGLGLVPGQAAVISSHRLRRGARSRKQLRFRVANTAVHEVGHTFGLDHCNEDRCPMLDAQGSIRNTDTSTGHLGPGCRAMLDRNFPRASGSERSP